MLKMYDLLGNNQWKEYGYWNGP